MPSIINLVADPLSVCQSGFAVFLGLDRLAIKLSGITSLVGGVLASSAELRNYMLV